MNEYTKDYYKILNIKPYSKIEQIKASYRVLSKKYHPDMGGSVDKMIELNEAYSILSDPDTKKSYDIWYADTIDNPTIFAKVFDPEKGVYYKKFYIKNIQFDYKKYLDKDNQLYVVVLWNGKEFYNQIVTYSQWTEIRNSYIKKEVFCHVYSYENGYYTDYIDEKKLPKDYKKYISFDNNLYIFEHNGRYIAIYYQDWLKKQKRFRIKVPYILLIIISLFIFGYFVLYSSEPQIILPAQQPISNLPSPQPIPNNNTVIISNYSSASILAPLEISTGNNYYYVQIVDLNGNIIKSIFIHPHSTIETDIPLGQYKLNYACGDTWYGKDKLFGPNGGYNKADETFHFYYSNGEVNGYSVTLYSVTNGNLKTSSMNYEDFLNGAG